MDAGSLIAVAGAQVVALTAIGVGVLQQRRSFANERQLADRESVRTVLSEAATIRHRLESALASASASLSNEGAKLFESERSERPYRDLGGVTTEAERLRGQMEIQLGPSHPATVAFDGVAGASRKVVDELSVIRIMVEFGGFDDEESAREMVRKNQDEIASLRKEFDAKAGEFVELAHAAAGAKL